MQSLILVANELLFFQHNVVYYSILISLQAGENNSRHMVTLESYKPESNVIIPRLADLTLTA